ncbi:MAG: hypothetical protein M5U28_32440 [Sandaracinaceae bacterium]|nr:hypothetical protein [Sandaracinaceae bacterium]
MRNDDLSAVVLFERQSDPDLRDIAAAITRELADGDDGEAPSGAIALPVAERGPRLETADVALVMDAASAERARAARVPRVAALFPRLALDWDGPLDVDLALVAHEALVEDLVARGVPAARVRTTGPVAPDGWAPAEDRAALRAPRPRRRTRRGWWSARPRSRTIRPPRSSSSRSCAGASCGSSTSAATRSSRARCGGACRATASTR